MDAEHGSENLETGGHNVKEGEERPSKTLATSESGPDIIGASPPRMYKMNIIAVLYFEVLVMPTCISAFELEKFSVFLQNTSCSYKTVFTLSGSYKPVDFAHP